MKYTLRYTGEFKRSLKRCLKRGYDERLLTDVLPSLSRTGIFRRNIVRMSFMASTKAIGSAISHPTGFLSGNRTTENWYC